MASIQGRRHGRHTYYYLVESRRIHGKPRPIVLQYLGRAEALLARLSEAKRRREPARADVVEFGAIAALWDLSTRLDVAGTIDRHVSKRDQGATVGQYLSLAAINRCVATTSKASFADWYRKTLLPRLCPVVPHLLSSQRFWHAMDGVSFASIRAIEEELSARIVRDFQVDLRTLCFDCTNFDTFIDSTTASDLARRGHAKSKRTDLKVVGLALLVALDGEIPLFSEAYPGNQPDSVTFESITEALVSRYSLLAKEAEDVTMVFDKGNNSRENLQENVLKPFHVIGSFVPSHHADLLGLPLNQFAAIEDPRLKGVVAHRTKKVVFGREWTVVVTRSDSLLEGQIRGIAQHLAKRRRKLRALQIKLRRSQEPGAKGKGYTRAGLKRHAAQLAQGQYLKEILKIEVTKTGGKLGLSFHTDPKAMDRLVRIVLGKRILFTDNHEWATQDIVLGYRSQYHVEAAFKQMKDRTFVSARPFRHWTDQKIRVHIFCCVLALTLSNLLRREVARKGIALTTDALLDELQAIQEVVNLYPSNSPEGGRPRAEHALTRRTRLQEQLFHLLDLARFQAS